MKRRGGDGDGGGPPRKRARGKRDVGRLLPEAPCVLLPQDVFAEIMAHADWNVAMALASTTLSLRERWRRGVRTLGPRVANTLVSHVAVGPVDVTRFFPNVERVDIERTTALETSMLPNVTLACLAQFKRLNALHLETRAVIGTAFFAPLANLTELDLCVTRVESPRDVFQLLTRLVRLRVCHGYGIDDEDLTPLAGRLETLALIYQSNITDAGVSQLTRLCELRLLCAPRVTCNGLAPLASTLALLAVTGKSSIDLDRLPLALPNLTHLDFDDMRIGRSPSYNDYLRTMTALRRLGLTGPGTRSIADIGLETLVNLQSLSLMHDPAACGGLNLPICVTDRALAGKPLLREIVYCDGPRHFSTTALFALPQLVRVRVLISSHKYRTHRRKCMGGHYRRRARERFIDIVLE